MDLETGFSHLKNTFLIDSTVTHDFLSENFEKA